MRKILLIASSIIIIIAGFSPFKNISAIDKIDKNLLAMGLDSTEMVGVFVQLGRPTVVQMSTFGGLKVFPAFELMRPDNQTTKIYESTLKRQQTINQQTLKEICPETVIGESFQYAFNGYYAEARLCDLEKIASMSGVEKIRYILENKLDRTKTRVLLGAEKVWSTVKDPSGRPVDGSGVLVSVVDTGLDYTHPDFGAQEKPVGDKVVISHDWAMNDNDCQEEFKTQSEHGTACASLIAGDGPNNTKTKVKEKGIAPKAILAGYKIQKLTDKGKGYILDGPAIMKAWENNIKEKIDISSNSWGRPGGDPQFEQEQLNCALAGCTVVVSNGNEGSPGALRFPIPQGQTASANSVIGVGATDESEVSELILKTAPDKTMTDKRYLGSWGNTGRVFSSYDMPLEVLDCGWGRPEDFSGLDLKGKIALIQRGPKDQQYGSAVSFKEKLINASNAGAKAVVLYNHEYGKINANYYNPKDNEKPEDFNFVPSYEILMSEGLAISKQLHEGNSVELGSVDANQNEVTVAFGKPRYFSNIAEYSSNGPTITGYLKPDVCAPGINIHAAQPYFFREKTKSDYMEDFGGTSAACPFVAGCAALVRQGRPDWNPFEIKRSLMNTAIFLRRTDGQYYLPFTLQGMGRVNVDEAIRTPVLIQPPSALIVANTGKINVADVPSELESETIYANLPEEVVKSTIPLKLSNYSKKAVTYKVSFELNSGSPEQIDVSTSASEITVPAAGKTPGVAWLGLTIKLPAEVEGSLNDVIVWFTDRSTNRKLHMGVCIYNGDPKVGGENNSFVTNLKFQKGMISPDGDGVDDTIEVTYDVTNGSWDWQWDPPLWSNYGNMLVFYALDSEGQPWSIIHIEDKFEIGPGKFIWDGKDINGQYLLPDGDWATSVSALCVVLNKEGNRLVQEYLGYDQPATFTMSGSPAPVPPTLSAYATPYEPGIGESFNVSIYLTNAKNVKSLEFKLTIPGANELVGYSGFTKGDFFIKDEPLAMVNATYSEDSEQFMLEFARSLNGASGDGIVATLNFIAKDSNYMDIKFSDVVMTVVGEDGKEIKSKVLAKNTSIAILPKPVNKCDFNRDGVVDNKDLAIIQAAIGTVEGQSGYNWRCDLNYDRKVNCDDLAIFARSYNPM